MTQEEINLLKKKILENSLSQAEKLRLLEDLNSAIEGMRNDLTSLKAAESINNSI